MNSPLIHSKRMSENPYSLEMMSVGLRRETGWDPNTKSSKKQNSGVLASSSDFCLFFKHNNCISRFFYSLWTFCLSPSSRIVPPHVCVHVSVRVQEKGGRYCGCAFVKNSRLSGFSKNEIRKQKQNKKPCFFDFMVLTFEQNFPFPPSNTEFETIYHNGKLLKHDKCRQTRLKLISENGDTGT